MSDYTPTTEDVAVCYMAAGALRTSRREHDALMEAGERYRPEFDRWLAEHDREVKAEAWDECLESLRPELEHELLYV